MQKTWCKIHKGKGFADTYGIDLELLVDKFKGWLGPIEDILDNFDDPV